MGIQFQGAFESLSRSRDVVLEGEEVKRQVVLVVCLGVCRRHRTIDQYVWLGLEFPPGAAAESSYGEGGGDPPPGPWRSGPPSYGAFANLTRGFDALLPIRRDRARSERRARCVRFLNGDLETDGCDEPVSLARNRLNITRLIR